MSDAREIQIIKAEELGIVEEILVANGGPPPIPMVTCPCCGDSHAAPNGDADYLKRAISRCDVCDARIVYGELATRVVVEPTTVETFAGPKDFLRLRFQDPKTKADVFASDVDPHQAFLIAQAIISMVRP